MVLSNRLLTIAGMVTKGNVVVDIGTDHGYLPIYLIKQEQIEKAIAMDINSGPLSRAKAHIEEYGLLNYIDTRLSDGAFALKQDEGDTLVIAGMGGNLVIKILTEGKNNLSHIKEFILQPQSELYGVRKFLQENEYVIVQENMILEEDKYYTVIKAVRGYMQPLEQVFLKYGKYLLENKNIVLHKFLVWEKNILTNIQSDLVKNLTENAAGRLRELDNDLALLQEALRYYGDDK